MKDAEPVIIPVEADLSGFDTALSGLAKESRRFSSAFGAAMRAAVVDGKSLDRTLRDLALRISDIALSSALKPLEGLAGNAIEGVTGALTQGLGRITPFANGGVVDRSTMFAGGGGLGIMGEAGPEAILPLHRGGDGRLGVRAGGAAAGAVNVTFNVTSPDVAGFRRSEGQLAAMLARTVSRGRGHL